MRGRCQFSYFSNYNYLLQPRRYTILTSSNELKTPIVSNSSRSEIDGLLKEIKQMQTRRGRGDPKLYVSASKLKTTSKSVGKEGKKDECSGTNIFPEITKIQSSIPTKMMTMNSTTSTAKTTNKIDSTEFTDIACTLQELEDALFELSNNEKEVMESKENNYNSPSTNITASSKEMNCNIENSSKLETLKESDVLINKNNNEYKETLSCWYDAPEPKICEKKSLLKILSTDNSNFTIELQEQPYSILSIINELNKCFNEVESIIKFKSNIVIVFSTLNNIPFFTPLQLEIELSPLSRLEVMIAKERFFQRMKEASSLGVSFKANLSSSALDFGTELLFMCNGKIILSKISNFSNIIIGFPSLHLGVWPSSCVLKCISTLIVSSVKLKVLIPTLNTLNLEDACKKFPELFEIEQNSIHRSLIKNHKNFFNELYINIRNFFEWNRIEKMNEKIANPLIDQFCEYCEYIENILNDNENNDDVKTLEMYSKFLGTYESRNVVEINLTIRRMHNRILNPLPRKKFIELNSTDDIKISNINEYFWIFLDGASPFTCRFIAENRSSYSVDNEISGALLIGDINNMKDVVELLDYYIIATPLGPPKSFTLNNYDLMEVQLIDKPEISNIKKKEVLTSSLAFLQSKEIPYIVTRGDAGNRLIATLYIVICQISKYTDIKNIENITKNFLGFRFSPFLLLDNYGIKNLENVIQRHEHMKNEKQVKSIAQILLSSINLEGFKGEKSFRGGFYKKNGSYNYEIMKSLISLEKNTLSDILLIILSALMNEFCRLLIDGCVETVKDINLISIHVFTLHASTGGLISHIENCIGFSTLVKSMQFMSSKIGIIDTPSSLLILMLEAGETFHTLSTETLERARRNS